MSTAPEKIVTRLNDYPLGRDDRWLAHRESYEPADADGVGGWPLGTGATEREAIAELLDEETWRDTKARMKGVVR